MSSAMLFPEALFFVLYSFSVVKTWSYLCVFVFLSSETAFIKTTIHVRLLAD